MRLRSRGGAAQVVLLAFLLAATDFELLDDQAAVVPAVQPFGLLETLPREVVDRARRCERHVVEVVTGREPDSPEGSAPRPGYDPASTTLKDRDAVKAAELTAAGQPTSARTVTRMRLRYAEQGLWGLVDQRFTAAAIWSAGPMSGWWPRSGPSWRRRRTFRRAPATG